MGETGCLKSHSCGGKKSRPDIGLTVAGCEGIPFATRTKSRTPEVPLSFAWLVSVSCPVLLQVMPRFREFIPESEASRSRSKEFLMVYTDQPTEALSHIEQLSGQTEGVLFKLASD